MTKKSKYSKDLDSLDSCRSEQEIKDKMDSLTRTYPAQRKDILERADRAINELEKGNKDQNKKSNEAKNSKSDKSPVNSETLIENQSTANEQNSEGKQARESKASKVPDKKYEGKQYCKHLVRTVGLPGLEGGSSSFWEITHPNCLSGLKPSSRWTVLIDETGSFSSNESSPNRIVGVFVPDDVKLPEYNIHACEEKDFSKIETIVQLLLNSRCGILGVSVGTSIDTSGKAAWLRTIEMLLELAVYLLPIDRENETSFDVKIEQRGVFDEKTDGNLISVHVKNAIIETDPSLKQCVDIKCKVVSKSGLLSYPDVVANLWNSAKYKNLRDYTCWENSCLLNDAPKDYDTRYTLKLLKEEQSPGDWEKLLMSSQRDRDLSFGPNRSWLKRVQENVKNNANLWFEYLDHTCKESPIKEKEPFIVLEELNWLKDNMPDSIKHFAYSMLAQTCLVVQQKYKQLFEKMGTYDRFENETNSLANSLDKSVVRLLRKISG